MVRGMRALRILLVLACMASAKSARAGDDGPFSLGLVIGTPTGLSLKYELERGRTSRALDLAVGQAVSASSGLQIHGDVLWHPSVLAREGAFDLVWYAGLGVRLLDHKRGKEGDDDFHIGPRGPLGLLFAFNEVPLEVFLEVALVLDYRTGATAHDDHDGIGVDLNAGIGVRYTF